jgi:hypothetical protein
LRVDHERRRVHGVDDQEQCQRSARAKSELEKLALYVQKAGDDRPDCRRCQCERNAKYENLELRRLGKSNREHQDQNEEHDAEHDGEAQLRCESFARRR